MWGRLWGQGRAPTQHSGGDTGLEGAPQHLGGGGCRGIPAVTLPPGWGKGEVTARRGGEKKSKRRLRDRWRHESKIVLGLGGGGRAGTGMCVLGPHSTPVPWGELGAAEPGGRVQEG